MTTIEIISIISPFFSAALTALITYKLTVKSKRFDILYENKIPAFKEVTSRIVAFKNFCTGRVAFLQGNEYSPFYEEKLGTLHHGNQIALALQSNSVFLSQNSRFLIYELLNHMSGLCNAEAVIAGGDDLFDPKNEYERMTTMLESIIDILYKELNLTNE